MRHFMLVGGLLLMLLSGGATAEVFRWVGDDGTVHYSDQSRPGAEKVPMRRAGPQRTSDSGDAPGADSTSSRSQRAAAIRQEECKKARERLAAYRDAASLTRTGEDGESRTLSADERVAAIARAEEDVAGLCGDGETDDSG